MEAKLVESVIKARIAGAEARARVEDGVLYLTVSCTARNARDAHQRIYDALSDAGVVFGAVKLHWFHDEWQRKRTEIEHIVREALKPLAQGAYDYSVGVAVDIAGSTLAIGLGSMHFLSPTKASEAQEILAALSQEILSIAGASRISIQIEHGLPTYSHDGPCEDDEYHEENPNWPSRTGNPSGKGRGNNPPKR